jgi:hypothetical protein
MFSKAMQIRLWPLLLATPLLLGATADPRSEFFEMRVRPLLASNCFSCHTSTRMGGLEMKSREAFLKGGKSGPAITSGEPEHSLLIQAVSYTNEKLKMPPSGKLKEADIEVLVRWIREGAVWPEAAASAPKSPDYVIRAEQRQFWSFQPVHKPDLPSVKDQAWPKAPIDRFVLAALESKNLKPARPADKRTLIRRAYFDLIGLPPTPDQVDAFINDKSPDAFAKVVDQLLASPHYGERWGRHWLDVARYSDDKLNSTQDEPYPNAFRYRDWVVQAFNDDMPYDVFVKAQLAGDLLPQKQKLVAGLGFYGLSPEFQDDRVDVTTRGFLALTVACAQCHDHKFDPIPTKDYYSLLGIFNSTKRSEWPLAPEDVVKRRKDHEKKIADQEALIADYIRKQSDQLGEILASSSAKYLKAAAQVKNNGVSVASAASEGKLDQETLERWVAYLATPAMEHPFLKNWVDPQIQEKFQETLLAVIREKRSVDEQNLIRLGGSKDRSVLSGADLVSLSHDKFILWRDMFNAEYRVNEPYRRGEGVLYYGDNKLDRFLTGPWKDHLDQLRADLKHLKETMPPEYPFLHTIADIDKPRNERVHIRGAADNLGDEVPRHSLSILCNGTPAAFSDGSGRLQLAESIADPNNPLTARVMVNRIWQAYFGTGIVRTASNFGQLGERPSNPELLDYLAARFVESKWSIKAIHREIVLSAMYALSAESIPQNESADPENRLTWRANRHRLDAESVRDSMLAVTGQLDPTVGGQAKWMDENYKRRTLYAFVSRRRPDPTLELFDFPNANETSEHRDVTSTPLQGLYFLNSGFVLKQSSALAERVAGEKDDAVRIKKAYRLLYYREPSAEELKLGLDFVSKGASAWQRYAQILLSSNEFLFVN